MLVLNYRVRREFKSSRGLLRVGTILTPEEARGFRNFKALLEMNYLVQHESDTETQASPKKGRRK